MSGMEGLAVIKRKRVEEVTTLSRTAIYARMQAGTFPRPIRIGARAVAWRVFDIERFLRDPAGYRVEGA